MSSVLENSYNRHAVVCDSLYYAAMFPGDDVPSTFTKEVYEDGGKERFCMKTMTYKYLCELFPDFSVVVNESEHYYVPTSCASTQEKKILYDGGSSPRGYTDANRLLIDTYNRAIVTIGVQSVAVLYDPKRISDIKKYLKDIYDKLPVTDETVYDDDVPFVGLVTCSNRGYDLEDAEISKVSIDIDKNYNDDFKPIYNDIVNFLDKDNRKSGIILLNGEPGTGKTYFIRHLINTVEGNYVIIPSTLARHMESPEFIKFLISNRNSIFILDDCEDVVKSRDNSIFSGVSSILNMSDGLMSDIFNGKFICTFNCDISKIDDAVLRKGRCAAVYTFDKLKKDKAQVIMDELGRDVLVTKDMTHAEIYNYDSINVPGTQKQNKVGF